MNTRYQIFVSSTYSDLREERERVIHELTRIGYIAVGMEQFPATDEEQLEYIPAIIDESDYCCGNPWKIRLNDKRWDKLYGKRMRLCPRNKKASVGFFIN